MGSEWNGVKSEGGMDCKIGTNSWGDVDKLWGLVLPVLVPPLMAVSVSSYNPMSSG